MRANWLFITLFSTKLATGETLVRPEFPIPVPANPLPILPIEVKTQKTLRTNPPIEYLKTNNNKSVVIINGHIVLEKDAYIFSDTVLVYGNITTLNYNFTIICRKLFFAERRFTNPVPKMPSISVNQNHIQSITFIGGENRVKSELALNVGKIKIFAGEIYGRPIIFNGRRKPPNFDAKENVFSEVTINYGATEFENTQDVFSMVSSSSDETPTIRQSLSPLRNNLLDLQNSGKDLATLVALQNSLPIDHDASKSVSLLIREKSRSIREKVFEQDLKLQSLANEIDPENSKALLDLFTPDDVSTAKIESAIKSLPASESRSLQDTTLSIQDETLSIFDTNKWIVDFTYIPLGAYLEKK